MPLERVNLARGSGDAPAGAPSSEKFQATPEEIRTIQEKMKDPVFVELMHDYMKSLEDPETRREEEAYLEQAEREAREGGDFSFEFVFPRPVYVVELLEPSNTRLTAAEARQLGHPAPSTSASSSAKDLKSQPLRSFLNFCQSDKVKAFTERTTGDRLGSNWEVPVSVSQRRVEVYNPVAAAAGATIPSEYSVATIAAGHHAKGDGGARADALCIVHDVVFHPSTLALAERSGKFMCFLTEIAVEHVNSGYGESNGFAFRRLPSAILSIGTPQNQTLRTKQGANPFAVDPNAPVLQRPTKHLSDAAAAATRPPPATAPAAAPSKKAPTTSATSAEAKRTEEAQSPARAYATGASDAPPSALPQLPPHSIAHRGSIDLTDAWRWSVSDKRVGVPQELVVKLTFAGVRRAAALDIAITADGRAVRVTPTAEQAAFAGDVPLPFAVEEVPARAQFDRSRGVLTLTLTVVPPPLPAGVPTAAELRKTLPGALREKDDAEEAADANGGTEEERGEASKTAEKEAVKTPAVSEAVHEGGGGAVAHAVRDESVGEALSVLADPTPSSSSVMKPTSSQCDPAEVVGRAEEQRVAAHHAEPAPATPGTEEGPISMKSASQPHTHTPEVAHIANQDRVAAMMAQVEAARAARLEAAAAAAAAGAAENEMIETSSGPFATAPSDSAIKAVSSSTPPIAASTRTELPLQPTSQAGSSSADNHTKARRTEDEVVLNEPSQAAAEKEEDIPFLRKNDPAAAASPAAASDVLRNVQGDGGGEEIDDVRARQQAWAAMMEAEMQVARAREEAEAAEAARATEVQAAKARRRLAAEKEQERLAQVAQAKRDTLPLSNKYIFAID